MSRQVELIDGPRRTRVVAGILRDADRKILITDRSRARSLQHLWEFPGGKVESGESAEMALGRELAEELGISTLEFARFQTLEHDYPDIRVSIEFFIVTGWQGTPAGIEGQQLLWVNENELDAEQLLPADAPIIAALAGRRESS